jgi:hypothetical protein
MKFRGLTLILLIGAALVFFLYVMKTEDKENIKEQVGMFSTAKTKLTKSNMEQAKKMIIAFVSVNGRLPDDLRQMKNMNPMFTGGFDAWGNVVKFEKLSNDNFRLRSSGPDQIFQTEDDIIVE